MKKIDIFKELSEKEEIAIDILETLNERDNADPSITRAKLGAEQVAGMYAFAKEEYKARGEVQSLSKVMDIRASKKDLQKIKGQAKQNNKKPEPIFDSIEKEKGVILSFVNYCYKRTETMSIDKRKKFVSSEIGGLLDAQKKLDNTVVKNR